MTKRDLSIDFLRATAIIFMTITHVNALFYLGKNPILDIFTTIGATVCFSIFLFSSAYVTGLKMQKSESMNLKNTLKRIIEIYIVYAILGVLVTYVLGGGIALHQINDILLLKNVPEFTEFLIAFIVFALLSQLFFKQIKKGLEKPILMIIITIGIFIIGALIYRYISQYTYPDPIRILLENIFGYKSLHRFPLTYYLPIYTFGILLSKYSSNKLLLKIFSVSVILFFTLLTLKLSKWYRWPPSLLFLLYGFMYMPFVLLIYRKFETLFTTKLFSSITNIGKYPLEQFFLSTFLVFIAKLFLQPSNSEFLSIFLNLGIIGVLILHPIVFHRKMV